MRKYSALSRPLAAIAAASIAALGAAGASAQEAGGERTPGEPYVAEVFTDWELRCITAGEPGRPERCEMFQLLLDEQDNPVAVMRVAVPLERAEGVVAAISIVTPIESLLAPGVRLRIDDGEPGGLPFTYCEPTGCLARLGIDEATANAFKAGGDAFIDIFALIRNDLGEIGGVPVSLSASLRGFTAAYDAMQARHVDFAEFVAEARAAAAENAATTEGEAAPSE